MTNGTIQYYVATVYKKDDLMMVSRDGENFYFYADKRTYSDLGINPNHYWTHSQFKSVKPAQRKDFRFFRYQIPPDFRDTQNESIRR